MGKKKPYEAVTRKNRDFPTKSSIAVRASGAMLGTSHAKIFLAVKKNDQMEYYLTELMGTGNKPAKIVCKHAGEWPDPSKSRTWEIKDTFAENAVAVAKSYERLQNIHIDSKLKSDFDRARATLEEKLFPPPEKKKNSEEFIKLQKRFEKEFSTSEMRKAAKKRIMLKKARTESPFETRKPPITYGSRLDSTGLLPKIGAKSGGDLEQTTPYKYDPKKYRYLTCATYAQKILLAAGIPSTNFIWGTTGRNLVEQDKNFFSGIRTLLKKE